MQANQDTQLAISCVQHAIEDAQGTIRAYDMKANSLGVLLTVALGVSNFNLLQAPSPCSKLFLIVSWVLGLAALIVLGFVLHPITNPIRKVNLGGYAPVGTYYVAEVFPDSGDTVGSLARRTIGTDWVLELTYEKMKLSSIRCYKHGWFQFAVKLSGATLIAIVVSVVTYVWEI